jgi:Transposase DDE domain
VVRKNFFEEKNHPLTENTMDWQSQLISIYLTVFESWRKGPCHVVQRQSNNSKPFLTDEEVVTIFFFGILQGRGTIREIYDYADQHFRDWFPLLGTYEAFNYRINKIHGGFIALCEQFAVKPTQDGSEKWVIDSLPIIMAGPKRSSRGKVAKELADKGYCSSKDLYFYGVKVHCLGELQAGTIPLPVMIGAAPASMNDLTMFKIISPELENGRIYGDKAYIDVKHTAELSNQNVQLRTPIKKAKDKHSFRGPETYSAWVSSIRQPIESFFNWLQQKTKIQNASKVRSSAGLIVHIFGRIAAAMMLTIFNL